MRATVKVLFDKAGRTATIISLAKAEAHYQEGGRTQPGALTHFSRTLKHDSSLAAKYVGTRALSCRDNGSLPVACLKKTPRTTPLKNLGNLRP